MRVSVTGSMFTSNQKMWSVSFTVERCDIASPAFGDMALTDAVVYQLT